VEHKEETLNPLDQRDYLNPFAPKREIACVENSSDGPCEDCSPDTTTSSLSPEEESAVFVLGIIVAIPIDFALWALDSQFAAFFTFVLALTWIFFFGLCFSKVKDKREAKRNRLNEWKRLVPSLDDGPPEPLEDHVVFEAVTIPSEDHESINFATLTRRWSEEKGGWVSANELPPSLEELDYKEATEFKIEETLSYTLIDRFADYCFAVRSAHQLRYAIQVRSQQTLEERKLEIETIPSYSKVISG
jgi:hypothetical protein